MSEREVAENTSPDGQIFATTRWSKVLSAKSDDEDRQEALQFLCRAYWLPVYGYIRRRGRSPHDAEDLTQGFFAHLLEGKFFDRADPGRGRFRGYLVTSLRHYVAREFERGSALKRGGGVQFVEWSEADAERLYAETDRPQLDEGAAYDSAWALTLLDRALARLAEEQRENGREAAFAALKPFLFKAPTRGEYEAVATALGSTRSNVALQVHRLNHRFSALVRLEVAATVEDPADVKDEMQHLFDSLRR